MGALDAALYEKWRATRDPDAFAEIVSRHSAMVYGTCKRVLGNPIDAEDAAQECFIELARARKSIKCSLGGWLHRVAVRRSLDRIRAESRRKHREHRFVERASMNSEVTWDDIQAHIDDAIAALPDKLREPIIYRFLEGQTQNAIARNLRISTSTVQYRLSKGIEEMRKFLKKRDVVAPGVLLMSLLSKHLTAEAAPTTLTAVLGKLTLAGATGAMSGALGTTPTGLAGLVGGLIMKKVTVIIAVIFTIAIGMWALRQKHRPEPIKTTHGKVVAERAEVLPEVEVPEVTHHYEVTASESGAKEPSEASVPTAPEGASIEGILVDSTRNPIANWSVFAARTVRPGKFEKTPSIALSGKDGEFLIMGLDGGEYRLYAVPRPQEGVHFSVRNQETVIRLAENEHKKGVILVFDEGLTISGRVVDSEGRSIPGATVYAQPVREVADLLAKDVMTEDALQKTDVDGNFRLIALLDAEYHVRARAEGYKLWTDLDNVPAGTDGLEIVLKGNEARVTGQVVDARTGNPVTDFGVAYVTGVVETWEPWLDRMEYNHVSDPQGRFEILAEHCAGALTVLARAEGYAPGLEVLQQVASGTAEEVNIRLEGGLTLEGIVVDAAGAPVPGAHVFLGQAPNPRYMSWERGANTISAIDGTFMITSLRPEDRFVSAAVRGRVPGVASIPPAISRGIAWVEIVLPAEGGRIMGVIMEGGQPISGCSVQVYTQYPPLGQQDHFSMGVRTDEGGRYSAEDLPEMKMAVATVFHLEEASYGQSDVWLVTEADVEAGKETEVSFNFVPGDACIEGRVLVEGKIPATRASVHLISDDGAGTREIHPTRTDAQGLYRLRWLPGGNAELVVGVTILGKYEEWSQRITLRGGQTARYDIDIGD